MSNNGFQALNSISALDPAVKLGLGAGVSSPLGSSHGESADSGITPLPFQTFTQAETSTPALVKSSAKPKTAAIHTPLVQEHFNSCDCPIRGHTAPLLAPRRMCPTFHPELRARPRLWLGFALPKPAPLKIDRALQPTRGSLCLGVQMP